MPNAAHQIAVQLLAERPDLLGPLAEKVLGRRLPGPLRVVDSTVRFVETDEARPALILAGDEGWLAVEVQLRIDPAKAFRWLVMMALKTNQTQRPGDLVVLTFSQEVADWAAEVTLGGGPFGTQFALRPVVILLSGGAVEQLLDAEQPLLGFFAAWAMQERHGPQAQRIVERAVDLSELLPDELRQPMQRAIMDVLSERMVGYLRSRAMEMSKLPLGPATKILWAEAKAEGAAIGKAEAVLSVLAARGLAVSDAQRTAILACRNVTQLDRWLQGAATAASAGEALH